MNSKKLSLIGFLLSFSILLSASIRVSAFNQVQVAISANNFYSTGIFIVLAALIIGFIGSLLGGENLPTEGDPTVKPPKPPIGGEYTP
jgi:hypothetical protein